MNLWNQFSRMQATQGPRYIGEVLSVDTGFGDVRAIVSLLPGAAQIEVTGLGRALEVGQRWIVQDGKIIDEAPSGTVFDVDI